MSKEIPTGRRVMDIAWMRDSKNTEYYGESLVLAMLLKVKKRTFRTDEDEADLRKIMKHSLHK